MSSTDYSTAGHSRERCFRDGARLCGGGHWSGANIAAMVLGFIIFAPLGFVVLIWTLLGRPIQALPDWLRDKWAQFFRPGAAAPKHSENTVFNEYQQTQYDRIREIRDEIRHRAEAFRAFRYEVKRRKDQQEFDDFMSNKPQKDADDT